MPILRILFVLVLALVAVAPTGVFHAPPRAQSESQPAKRPYKRDGNQSMITGTVSFLGRQPRPWRLDMSADSVCASMNPRTFLQTVIVRRNRLTNAFVYVKSGSALDELSFETPSNPALLDQRRCSFIPRVSGIQVNQMLEVRNSDPTVHNVHEVPKNNPDWNQSQPTGAKPLVTRFARPEVMVPIKCNQHPWMKAYVGVLRHPFFAVSASNGTFRIEGLPPGDYTIAVWHERLGEKTSQITVSAGSQSRLDFKFEAKDYPDLYPQRGR